MIRNCQIEIQYYFWYSLENFKHFHVFVFYSLQRFLNYVLKYLKSIHKKRVAFVQIDKIENFKIPRSLGALFLIFIAFLIFIIIFLFILPVFYRQFFQFVQMLPIFYEWILNTLEHNLESVAGNKIQIHENVKNFQESIKNNIGFLFDSFLSSTLGIFNFVLDSFITLILTFYLLLDWDRIISFISGWITFLNVLFSWNFLSLFLLPIFK